MVEGKTLDGICSGILFGLIKGSSLTNTGLLSMHVQRLMMIWLIPQLFAAPVDELLRSSRLAESRKKGVGLSSLCDRTSVLEHDKKILKSSSMNEG